MKERFFFKYCRNGHMLYARGQEIEVEYCKTCGEKFLDRCDKCSAPLANSFTSMYFPTLNKPMSFPKQPSFCQSCGEKYPWTTKEHAKIENSGIWVIIHPKVTEIAKRRFDVGYYADAVESTFKYINNEVKKIYKETTGDEIDGVSLMRKAFSPNNPTIILDDLTTETGKNIQQGYMDIFAGSIAAIRNPKAHNIIDITEKQCIHLLVVGSLLLSKLEERKKS